MKTEFRGRTWYYAQKLAITRGTSRKYFRLLMTKQYNHHVHCYCSVNEEEDLICHCFSLDKSVQFSCRQFYHTRNVTRFLLTTYQNLVSIKPHVVRHFLIKYNINDTELPRELLRAPSHVYIAHRTKIKWRTALSSQSLNRSTAQHRIEMWPTQNQSRMEVPPFARAWTAPNQSYRPSAWCWTMSTTISRKSYNRSHAAAASDRV